MVDRWLAAQNAGDFAVYEKFYATKFEGVKRVGSRVVRMRRVAWLADRHKMFKRPFTVEARDLKVTSTSTTAEATFVQNWATKRFEDLGPKRLFMIMEGGVLKIAREEMLRSDVVRGAGASPLASGEFSLVVNGHLVLPAPADLKVGEPKLVKSDTEAYVAMAPVEWSSVPPDLQKWLGASVRVDGNCEATVTGFAAISRVVPHFGTVRAWKGELEGGETVTPATEEQIARDVFGPYVLGASLNNCTEGTYGRLASLPGLVEAEHVEDPVVTQKAVAAFAKLASVLELQKFFEAEGNAGPWYEKASDAKVQIAIYRQPVSRRTVVSVLATGGEGCGSFEGGVWAIWRVQGSGAATRLTSSVTGLTVPGEVLEALDVDRDGELEFLIRDNMGFDTALIDLHGIERSRSTVRYNDCRC